VVRTEQAVANAGEFGIPEEGELLPLEAATKQRLKVKVILRPTISRPLCHGVGQPSGTRDQFFPFSL
jgi:hypothetical protein